MSCLCFIFDKPKLCQMQQTSSSSSSLSWLFFFFKRVATTNISIHHPFSTFSLSHSSPSSPATLQAVKSSSPKPYSRGIRDIISAELLAVERIQKDDPPRFATWVSLLKLCGDTRSLGHGRQVHAHITKYRRDQTTFLANRIIQMYGECGSMREAQAVFDRISRPNVHSWTVLMGAYAKNNCGESALECLYKMELQGLKPNHVTFVCALDACSRLAALEKGKELHTAIMARGYEVDMGVGTALVSMYGKCGSLENAIMVFDKMPRRNVITWNAIISACIHNGNALKGLELFYEMQHSGTLKPDTVTFVCAIDACGDLSALEEGRKIHAFILENEYKGEMNVCNALISMYGKCGSLLDARMVFDELDQRDVVSWNALIAACAQNGRQQEALGLYKQMLQSGIRPDQITFVSLLTACSHTGQVRAGKHYFDSMMNDYSIQPQLEHYVCLVDVLARSGLLTEAKDLIQASPFKTEAMIWLCLLGACRTYGDLDLGLQAAKQVCRLHPGSASPYVLLSSIYATAGNMKRQKERGRLD